MMEKLSLNSFIQHGHNVHLYTYGDIEGVPNGVVVKDARSVTPEEQVFSGTKGPGKGSYAEFSDRFRYKLLYQRGGIWIDCDVVCLKRFNFRNAYVFAKERHPKKHKLARAARRLSVWLRRYGFARLIPLQAFDREMLCSGIIKAPAGCTLMKALYETCLAMSPGMNAWGQTGPILINRVVREMGLSRFAVPSHVFLPIAWYEVERLLECRTDVKLSRSYAIHLFNEIWRRKSLDKNGRFSKSCLYEKLKQSYL